ncbi:MAG: cytochrome c oxidase subunit 3 [Chitinophagales bacterium]|nr:cytochrome c oxidase subunit 3 [Chitinophagales bacterium]
MAELIRYNPGKIHPQKFALWVGMAGIAMMFAALTSAYIVKQAAGNWLEFSFPNHFYFSTISILLSSVFLHQSFVGYKAGNERVYKLFLFAGFIFGSAFVVLQYFGWQALYGMGVDMKGNASGGFFYLITGLHVIHVLGGIAALLITIFNAFSLKFKVTEKRKLRYDLVINYWHFVDILWVYLFIFLLVIK